MLFRRRFTHCAMAIPFILLSPSLFFFIPLARCESHLRRASAYYVTQINRPARDIITVALFSRVLYYIVNFEIIALDK